jgi:DNA invertase Pin-like site-specific DNA recombinase
VSCTIAYCRVSSRDQNPQLQLDALHTHGYDYLFAETESGKRGVQRPEFTRAPATLQAGDTLVFWKSDRWGRSAAHVLTTVGELRHRGVTIKSLTENFDLDTKEGRFMFAVLAAAAEYELELRAERQAEGIAAARRRQAAGSMLSGKKTHGPAPGDRLGSGQDVRCQLPASIRPGYDIRGSSACGLRKRLRWPLVTEFLPTRRPRVQPG